MQLEYEDVARLDSWIATIAQELRPGPVMPTAEGQRLGRKGSLALTTTALWHDHQAGKGGHGALSLIQHLRQCGAAAAGYWAAAWLDAHRLRRRHRGRIFREQRAARRLTATCLPS
jgi:hypothetical protein